MTMRVSCLKATFVRTALAALALTAAGCGASRPPAPGGKGDFLIEVTPKAGGNWEISWDGGRAAGVDVVDSTGGHMWFVTSFDEGIDGPLMFGEPLAGPGSVLSEKKPLVKGTKYVVDIGLISGAHATQSFTP